MSLICTTLSATVLTGIPVDVRMIESSDGENNRLELAFAALNLASTRLGRLSDSPRRIVMNVGKSRPWIADADVGCSTSGYR